MKLDMKSWNMSVKHALNAGYSIDIRLERRFGYTSGLWDHENKTFIMWDVSVKHRVIIEEIIKAHNKKFGGAEDE